MFDLTRIHSRVANSAASRADFHQLLSRPSGEGNRTGQKNTMPWRLIAVWSVLVTNSPASSATRPAVTMYSSRSSRSSTRGKWSRYSAAGCTRTKSCGPGLRTGTVVQEFLYPDRFGEGLAQAEIFRAEGIQLG